MIPVHTTTPRHWFLVYVNTSEARIQIYDSLKSSGSTRYLPVCERVSRILGCINGNADDYIKPDIRLLDCAQQPSGSVDCGVYATQFAKLLASGVFPAPDKFDRISAKDMRKIMYWELRFGRIQQQSLGSAQIR